MKLEMILSGFGGQGILFAGNLLAYCAMIADYRVTYLPVYGPEMRGGTCNCTVIISSEEIASPLVSNPSFLLIMNMPSFNKFVPRLKKGGKAIINSDLVNPEEIKDITKYEKKYKFFWIPVNLLAEELGTPNLANLCAVGAFYQITKLFTEDQFKTALKKVLGEKKMKFFEPNLKAFYTGAEFVKKEYNL